MESKRQRQVGELVRRNFSIVVQNEGGYIYGTEALVTVTNVKMSPDMGLAKIYLSVYNVEDKQTVILEMQEHQQKLRQVLANRIKKQVRRIPQIHFYLDDTLDEMYRLNELFHGLKDDNQMGSSSEEE